ncbi:MAG: restriction endonuclease subunit S, partial [Waddliaceae bacterium]
LKKFIPDTTVWVYGSRVKGTARPQSDLDIVVFAPPEQESQVSSLKEAFEESNLPFRVDLFVWDEVPEQFRKNIEEDHVILRKKTEKTVPKGWKELPIKEVAIVNELSIKEKNAPEKIEYIDIASVEKGRVNTTQSLDFEMAPGRARRIIRDNDSLIATVRPNLEHYAFIKKAKKNTIASTGFAVVTAKKVHPRFLYYYLTSKPFTAYLTRIAESHTSAYPAYNPDVIENAHVLLPSPSEQRAIAHILGSLDDKIELNRRMNETLEAMAQALFKSWFVDFDPVIDNALTAGNPIPEELKEKAAIRENLGDARKPLPKEIQKLFPDEFEFTEELGWIPKGWGAGSLKDIADNPRRGLQAKDIFPGTPYIALQDMPQKNISLSVWGNSDGVESGKFHFQRGEILFGKLRPYFHKVGVAPVDGVCSTDILVVIPKNPEWFAVVLGHVTSPEFIEHVTAASTGKKMPRTNWDVMGGYKILIPPKMLAERFTQHVNMMVEKLLINIEEMCELSKTRDTLLPKLLSGELRIQDAEKFVENSPDPAPP